MTISIRAFIFAGVAVAVLPGTSISEDTKPPGYVIQSYTSTSIVTGGYGQCWHTSYWTPDARLEQCDPNAKPPEKPAAAEPPPVVPPPQAKVEEPPKPAETQPLPAETAAATPLPPPQPEPAPRLETALLPQTVHYSADTFFDFDESTLRPAGKAALDDLVRQLGEIKYGSIRVVGHTDRIGGQEYNRELSDRRANAVKNYLVRNSIPADRVEAVGKGKSDPTVKPTSCTGPVSPKVIACLQPDRRVDIEVAGTKEATTGTR